MLLGTESGALALVGSGEYSAAMNLTDRRLLATLGERAAWRVAVIPTASALEEGGPERWNALGVRHFEALGAQAVPIWLRQREDAHDESLVEQLASCRFFYFSGGSPDHCLATLVGTPAWDTIADAAQRGAVIAGCSAGAMMLGSATLSVRAIRSGAPPRWHTGLGMARGLAIMPHFDRMRSFMSDEVFEQVLASAPEGVTLVGIDEDTALIYLPATGEPGAWAVSGRQRVTVFDGAGMAVVYQPGDEIDLPPPV
jgi:cyanophycinase